MDKPIYMVNFKVEKIIVTHPILFKIKIKNKEDSNMYDSTSISTNYLCLLFSLKKDST